MPNKVRIGQKTWQVSSLEEVAVIPIQALNLIAFDSVENRLALLYFLSSPKRPSIKRALVQAARQEAGESDRIFKVIQILDPFYQARKVATPQEEVSPLISSFTHEGIKYHLPKPDGNDMTLEEWTVAITSLEQYSKTSDEGKLMMVVASICRPYRSSIERESKDFDGYPREHFNEELLPALIEDLAGLKIGIVHACIDFLSRMSQLLALRYPLLFEGESTEGPNWGWVGTIIALSGDEIERMAVVKKMNLHQACVFMTRKRLDHKAYERQLEEIRKKGRK
ncbi:MAG: hypothetical protein AAFP92_18415 [Bacteroidota bacterium]